MIDLSIIIIKRSLLTCTVAWRYEFYFLMLRTIFYSHMQILFFALKNKIHIFTLPCNILYTCICQLSRIIITVWKFPRVNLPVSCTSYQLKSPSNFWYFLCNKLRFQCNMYSKSTKFQFFKFTYTVIVENDVLFSNVTVKLGKRIPSAPIRSRT